jgi:hypothetical protein
VGCYIALTMKRKTKPSPAEGDFLFEIDPEPLDESVTAFGGVPLLVRAIRSLDVPGSVKHHLQIKQRERGFDEATYIESFLNLERGGRRLSGRFRAVAGGRGVGRDAGA